MWDDSIKATAEREQRVAQKIEEFSNILHYMEFGYGGKRKAVKGCKSENLLAERGLKS